MSRAEILAAIARVLARTGRETFNLAEVIGEMDGSGYSASTIITYVTTAPEVERVERGQYRLRPLPSGD